MYLGLILIIIAVIAVIGGIFSGGTFTIILLPVAAIAVIGAVTTTIMARIAGVEGTRNANSETMPTDPIQRKGGSSPHDVPVTPDEYLKTRRQSQ